MGKLLNDIIVFLVFRIVTRPWNFMQAMKYCSIINLCVIMLVHVLYTNVLQILVDSNSNINSRRSYILYIRIIYNSLRVLMIWICNQLDVYRPIAWLSNMPTWQQMGHGAFGMRGETVRLPVVVEISLGPEIVQPSHRKTGREHVLAYLRKFSIVNSNHVEVNNVVCVSENQGWHKCMFL